jgi:2-dehydro-3-deoxyglucarate aldolase/4-hydroxy-2-oxoheptanedioate aldolase
MKDWLHTGTPKIGTVASIAHPVIAELIRNASFDWVWIDAEHGGFDEASAATFCAIFQQGPKAFVRVPDKSPTTLKRYLDIGPDGIIIPQVNSLDEINDIMRWSLYPPAGERSFGTARAHGYDGTFSSYTSARQFSIIVQIETAAGLHNLREILRDGRIDGVLIGPYDLSGSLGLLGQVSNTVVQDAIRTILGGCKSASIPCGIFAGNAEAASLYLKQGFEFVGVGLDVSIFLESFKNLLRETREKSGR